MKKYVVIVAGGKGLRMNAALPKQFIPIHGKPVLMRSIETFYNYDNNIDIVLVLPEAEIETWQILCNRHSFTIIHQIIAGGETRFDSVSQGLKLIGNNGLVAVHDGVRPFASTETIENCFQTAAKLGNAIPAIELVDSIRKIENNQNIAVNRTDYRLVQTPQVFDIKMLKKAYEKASSESPANFTDDASVFSFAGHTIQLVNGNRENIKITTHFDLIIAEALIANFI